MLVGRLHVVDVFDAPRPCTHAISHAGLLTISFTVGALATGALYDWNSSIEETLWVDCVAVVLGSLIWRSIATKLSRRPVAG